MSEVKLKKGEVVIFTDDYEVFGYNAKDKEGMFYREVDGNKYLVYLPDTKEWCEPKASILKRKKEKSPLNRSNSVEDNNIIKLKSS